MKVNIVMILFLASLLLTCREVPIDFPLPSQNLTSLVVEGILTNEKINHRIKLTLPYTLQNGNAKPATGAIVTISDGTDVALLTEYPAGSGEYYTSQGRAVFGKTYTLTIQYQGRTYVAKDSSVPVEPLQTLDYRRVNDLYTLNLPRITGQDAHYIDHQINWTNTPSCITGSTCKGRVMSYHLNTLDVNEIFKPEKATFYFPVNTTIIRTKYSVSPAYKAFLRSVLSETEWRGGVFDVQRADATTNLSEGAIGFFAVSTVVSDTTVVIQKP